MTTTSNNVFDQAQLQELIARKNRIDAESAAVEAAIAAALGGNSHSSNTPFISVQNNHDASMPLQKQDVPRRFSQTESNMARELSSRSHRNSLPMGRSLSQRSAQMNRSGSNNSKRTQQTNPFSGDNSVPPLPTSTTNSSSSIDQWASSPEDPYYSFAQHTQMRRSGSRQQSTLDNVAEVPPPNVGEDPAAFLARSVPVFNNHQNFVMQSSPIEIPSRNNFTYNQYDVASSYGSTLTPTLTSGTTLPSDMSRQGSARTDAMIGGVAMMAVNSNMSAISDIANGEYNMPEKNFSNALLRGTGGAIANTQSKLGSAQSIAMDRSSSSDSTSSSSSSRSREQLQRVNQLAAARPIKPKAEDETLPTSTRKDTTTTTVKSIAIPKQSTYVRPKRDPLFCDMCNEKPEGYRGPHELNRHIQRAHNTTVKRWKCVEPKVALPKDSPVPFKPLSKCKACSEGKTYGIDYNAAAHLRRAHFVEKNKSKGARTKGEKGAKKASKSSGDWPKMEYLRPWLEETWDANTKDDDDENDFDFDNLNNLLEDDPPTSTDPVTTGSFLNTSENNTLDAYPTPISTLGYEQNYSPVAISTPNSRQHSGNDYMSSTQASQALGINMMPSTQLQFHHDPNIMSQTQMFNSPSMLANLPEMSFMDNGSFPLNDQYFLPQDTFVSADSQLHVNY